jgi:hypothetical protein
MERLREFAGEALNYSSFRDNFVAALSAVVEDSAWDIALRAAAKACVRENKRRQLSLVLAIAGLLALLTLTSPRAGAQGLPDAPKPKVSQQKLFDLETVTELELVAGSLAADAMSTEKLLEFNHSSVGCGVLPPHCQRRRDGNPIARVFVRNRAGTGLYFGGVFALDVYSTYLLRKHHHPRIARVTNLTLAALEGAIAGRNYASVNNSNLEFLLHHPFAVAGRSKL